MLTRSGFCAFAIADLLCSEPESADAAAPTRRRAYRDSRHRLVIGKPGTNQFATTRRTLSLNHKLRAPEISCHYPTKLMALRLKRMGLLDGKSRTVAIPVTFHTSVVVTFVLGIGQHLGFGAYIRAVLTSEEVPLVFRVGSLARFHRCQFRVVAVVPSVRTILCVTPEFCCGHFLRFRQS